MTNGAAPPAPARPRVAMIVDNVVEGDSRVQKVAHAAAEAGFEVVLLGRTPAGAPADEFYLDGARVVRLPMSYPLHGYRRRNPGRSLRWPLAYPSRERQHWTARRIDAGRRELVARSAAQRTSGVSGAAAHLRRAALVSQWVALKGRRLVHGARSREFSRAVRKRKDPRGLFDDLMARAWARLTGRGAWRRLEPLLLDYELVFGPFLDTWKPDLVHAHDFRMVGIAVRYADRARDEGRPVRVVYDAHEYLPGVTASSLRWQLGNEAHESTYAPRADAIITVSEPLADLLATRHNLRRRPIVVLNAPQVVEPEPSSALAHGGIRAACGLGPDQPLLVYSGSGAPQRGLHTMVEGLADLPEIHVALVISGSAANLADLGKLATRLGVAGRLHVLPYVPQNQVVAFLRSADVGVIPILHYPNHEIALITKYLEYAHAGLPIVVSDVEEMARTTKDLGNGEIFIAGDTRSYVAAVRVVLAEEKRYRGAYDRPGLLESWSWPEQAAVLVELYRRLLAGAYP